MNEVMEDRDEDRMCSKRLHVLSDATRLRVARQLMKMPMHVGELSEALQVEQSLLSHHLKVMRDAGVVAAERDGKAMLYRIAADFELSDDARGLDLGCCQIHFESD